MIVEATEADVLNGGPPDDELITDYRVGHAGLVRALRDADPGVEPSARRPSPPLGAQGNGRAKIPGTPQNTEGRLTPTGVAAGPVLIRCSLELIKLCKTC